MSTSSYDPRDFVANTVSKRFVIEALRASGASTRAELISVTGMSKSGLSTLIAQLIQAGVVEEIPITRTARAAGLAGRPATHLRLRVPARACLGIEVGHNHVRVVVGSAVDAVFSDTQHSLDADASPQTALSVVAEMVAHALLESDHAIEEIGACVLGVPTPVNPQTGIVSNNNVLPTWAGLEPGRLLGDLLGMTVTVENDANLGALAEARFGAAAGTSHAIYAKVGSGIGLGLIFEGRLHHGHGGTAGEIGHIQIRPEGVVCRCGARGCLETVASVPRMVEALRQTHGADLGIPGLLRLIDSGDAGALRVVSDSGRIIGETLAQLCTVLSPQIVVIGGDLGRANAIVASSVRESLGRFALPGTASEVRVTRAALGTSAEVLGALSLAIGISQGHGAS